MKKIAQLLLITLLASSSVFGQAFEKGNINIDLGLGFGAYGTKLAYKDAGVEVSATDGAASFMVPLNFEYGITDRIGLGLQLGMSNYFINNEDSTEKTESVKSIDFALRFNFHLLNSDRNDLFIGLAVGGSSINWEFNNSSETLSGSGSYISLSLTDRIFFSDNVGILFNLGYTGYNYGNITLSGSDNPNLENITFSLKGVNFGTGLAVKF